MSESLTENEIAILSKVFEGNFPSFMVLLEQIDCLNVTIRKKEYYNYLAYFGSGNDNLKLLIGHEENIEVRDTRFTITGSAVVFYVNVSVIEGCIHRLHIGADFEFKTNFTIAELFWNIPNDEPLQEGSIIFDANKRDFKKAVGYIPMYK